MDDLSRFCCQNPKCPDYGKRGGENLSVCGRYGPNHQRRMLRCRTCKARFSERKGTALFGSTLPEEKVLALLEHIDEGCGVRKTSRLVGVHRDTVTRYSRLAGEHARAVHDELVAFSPQYPRGAVRRKVVLRGQEGEALRPGQPRRRQAGR
jgi:LacI family transcriptional regulator